MVTRARIVRDERVRPGGEGVLALPGEVLFVVSADGVTAAGAHCLERAWGWYIDRGIWRYQEAGGVPILRTSYHLTDALDDAACEVDACAESVDIYLSPRHFTRGSANGLEVVARASVRAGWAHYEPARHPLTAS